jgi:putative membrane protein
MPADTAGNPIASTQDASFVYQASAGGMAEVMMGHLAMQRGQTQAERNFGRMLVADHTKANDQLMGIAQTVMLRTASGPNAMQQSMDQQLQSAPADAFDAMFNHCMISAHERTIALFKTEAHGGENPQLRHFAAMTLPALYAHLRIAEALSPGSSAMPGARMSSMNGMSGMAAPPADQGAMMAPVSGNPDNSADQLNARELTAGNPS